VLAHGLPLAFGRVAVLIGLRLPDTLADTVALGLSKGSGDGEEQLGYPVAVDDALSPGDRGLTIARRAGAILRDTPARCRGVIEREYPAEIG
jgi:hypothetical protein